MRREGGIRIAQGYDFRDLAFMRNAARDIAIDAGPPDRVKAALSDLDLPANRSGQPPDAHPRALGPRRRRRRVRGPGTRVIAQVGFPAGLDRERDSRPPFRYFTGAAGEPHLAITPDQLISEPTALTVGGADLVLYPAAGGETSDALLVHLPVSGVLLRGRRAHALPRPAVHGRGSPEGLLEALAFIDRLRPRLLIHGHPPLTDLLTAAAVPGSGRR